MASRSHTGPIYINYDAPGFFFEGPLDRSGATSVVVGINPGLRPGFVSPTMLVAPVLREKSPHPDLFSGGPEHRSGCVNRARKVGFAETAPGTLLLRVSF